MDVAAVAVGTSQVENEVGVCASGVSGGAGGGVRSPPMEGGHSAVMGMLQGRGELESSGDLSTKEACKTKFQKHVKENVYPNVKYLPRGIPGFAQLIRNALTDCFQITDRVFLSDCHEGAVVLLLGELKKRVNYSTKNFNDIKRRCEAVEFVTSRFVVYRMSF